MLTRGLKKLDPIQLRKHVLHMSRAGSSVHVGCAFSMIEMFAALYSKFARYNPANPADPDRDYVLLSKGHGAMAYYACYHELGWIGREALDRYFADGSDLHGLAEWKTPGFEISGGSLGHGLPIATGIALGLKRLQRPNQKVYCLVGDGEMNEGPMWEALLFAAQHTLDNLIVMVDANAYQAMGAVKDIINLEPFAAKFESFGFEVVDCDGHDLGKLDAALTQLALEPLHPGRPKALIARTVKGKGVSFMEANNQWHYLRLDDRTMAQAMAELQ
jgi:transketolase